MNDTRQGGDDMGLLGPAVGFAIGALVGAGVALLLAPASGERTRSRIANTARRLSRDARQSFEDTREAASGLGADVKSAIEAGRDAFMHDGEGHEPRPVSRIAQTLNPTPPRTP